MADQKKYTSKLADSHVLVIGGSSGIGYGVAEACAEYGAKVTIASSNPTRVESAVSSLQKAYPSASFRVTGHACDMSDDATMEANAQQLFEKTGKVDHIVYTAGDAFSLTSMTDFSVPQLKKKANVRFFAPLVVVKTAVLGGHLTSNSPECSITLTTGTTSEKPIPGSAINAGFASGMHGMMRGLALDLKPVRVNLVSLGAVLTPLWDPMGEDRKAALMKQLEGKMATGTVGQVEDVAEAYLYLMKDQNVTGSLISTNGGALIMP